jgi:uncharacterized coiled-coil DUF342 family protein
MKYIITTVIVLGVILGGITFYPKTAEYISPEIIEKEVVKEVNPLDARITQREKELEEKYTKIKTVEARLDVLKEERTSLDNEIKTLQKELAGFMTGTP